MNKEKIVAVGLLTQRDLDWLGKSLRHVFPVIDDDHFATLLRALDKVHQTEPKRS